MAINGKRCHKAYCGAVGVPTASGVTKQSRRCPLCFRQRSRLLSTISDMQSLAEQKGGKCLAAKFLGTKSKLLWQCQKGHRWQAQPGSIRAGTWCPVRAGIQRLTIEDMRKTAKEHGGQCLSNKYVNGRTKLRWRCAKGHEWEAVPDSLRQGTWCPTCAVVVRIANRGKKNSSALTGLGNILGT